MDIFKRMANDNPMDFSVFKAKRTPKEAETPMQNEEKAAEPIPFPKQDAEPIKEAERHEETDGTEEPMELDPMLDPDKQEEEKTAIDEDKSEKKGKVISFKQPENRNEEASVKLEAELETAKSTLLPVFPIVRYLKNKCMADSDFAALVLDERKKLEKCFDYVAGEVKKALNSQNGWLDDNEVYAYAETYYMTSEEEFERLAAEKEEKEKQRRAAVEQKRKEQEEKRKKTAKANKKKTEDAEKAIIEKAKAEADVQSEETEKPMKENPPEEKAAPVMQEQLCLEM